MQITRDMIDEFVDQDDIKGSKVGNKIIQESLNLQYINYCSKKCPHCQTPVSKIEGCNKMTCFQCGKHFCWSCLKLIDGYDHFKENMNCWGILEAEI